MKLYLSHSGGFDYQGELYSPLKQTLAKTHDIFFPHDKENLNTNSKDLIAHSDFVLAEVTYPSTGEGIELGWASAAKVPIVCFYRSGSKISNSLHFVSESFIEYETSEQMVTRLNEWLSKQSQA